MNDLKIFNNNDLGLMVRTIQNDDGSISINAEDTAVGFGWTQMQTKKGKQYTSIRWETLNGYCAEFGFPNKLGKDDYIPESLFYRLGMKANNAVADKFQNWLALEVIPEIRKTGSYRSNQEGIPLKEQVESLQAVADMLRMNDASKLLMLEGFYKGYNIPTEFLPKYELNGSRQMKAATTLLNECGYGISAVKFNRLLADQGYLEEKTRPSSKGNEAKFKSLTEKGLQYGENAVSPHNQKETQPLYYEDTFRELVDAVLEGKAR